MTHAKRVEILKSTAQAILFALDKEGAIKVQPGQGKAAIDLLAISMANRQEEGIEEAADLFKDYSGYESVLNEAARSAILKLKE